MSGPALSGIAASLLLVLTGCLAAVALAFGGGLDSACLVTSPATQGGQSERGGGNSGSEKIISGAGRYDTEQITNAASIVVAGRHLSIPLRGQVIAVATAIQESSLRNIDHGDEAGPDSLGLFQQRSDWAPRAQRMHPSMAARMFYTGGRRGQPGLLDIPNWPRRPLTEVAQAVQRSAHPGRYARWEPDATALVASITRPPERDATRRAPTPRMSPGLSDFAEMPPLRARIAEAASSPEARAVDAVAESPTPNRACSLDTGLPATDVDNQDVQLPPGYRPPRGTSPAAARAITWALAQRGSPYSFGGDCTAPYSGTPAHQCDCSSLVQAAYRAAGVTLPRTTTGQVRAGRSVQSLALARAGDLIFIPGSLGTRTNPRHVGIYLGNGLILNAPGPGDVVKIVNLEKWAPQITHIRRAT